MPTDLEAVFDELFPICRSITGKGIRDSLTILKKHIPLEIKSVATGTRVFDWTVPQEWELKRATLKDPNGEIILDTEDTNLHVLNFSEPFSGEVHLEELEEHLYSIPDLPNAIPYVTSYYSERWGLCMTQKQRETLQDGKYRVDIETEKKDGFLNYGICYLEGQSDETILITSYLCHPSLANNELSGPIALLGLYKKLEALKSRRYSYCFVLLPETIGSITFLAKERENLEAKLKAGIVLTCLGGKNTAVSFKLSRHDWLDKPCQIDFVARRIAASDPSEYRIRDFTPTGGSDERQFCSPGINWPVIQAAKTIYGEYKEYHTSLDSKELMSIETLKHSVEQIFKFLQVFEMADKSVVSKVKGCEPQLGRRDLYPSVNGPMTNKMSNDGTTDKRYVLNNLLNVLSLSDGSFTILDMSEKLGIPCLDLFPIISTLVEKEIVTLETSFA